MKKYFGVICALLLSVTTINANAAEHVPTPIVEGQQYIKLNNTVPAEKEVIEFFSFYCGACFLIETQLHMPQTIKAQLPEGATMKKYHIDSFGGLSDKLSEAWAIATILGVEDKVAEPIFKKIHEQRNLRSENDIIAIFAQAGVPAEQYNSMKNHYLVKLFLDQQTAAFHRLKPNSVPSFYVNGKYQVVGNKLDTSSEKAMVDDHSRVINYLLELNGN